MKVCVVLPASSIKDELFNSSFNDFQRMNIYEFLYFSYDKFKLENHYTETIIPSFYMNTIENIIFKNDKPANITDIEQFLLECNIIDFNGILKRIIEKIKLDEIVKKFIFDNSSIILNSHKCSLIEETLLNFLIDNNHPNIIDRTIGDVDSVRLMVRVPIDVTADNNIQEKFYENDIVRVCLGYLSIIVNIRDQLRFAQIFNVPDRKLNHHAFTHLRHESELKQLSMAQIALSYVTRLKLGGKSYAPPSNCVLHKYIFGLSELVNLINKLQSIMEDNALTMDQISVIRKMLNCIQSVLLQDRSSRFNRSQIECVKNKIIDNLVQFSSRTDFPLFEENSSRMRQITDLIRRLLADYAIRPDNYCDSGSLVIPHMSEIHKTPKGGCSKNICILYESPDTCDSPYHLKQKTKENHLNLVTSDESKSLPAWSLYSNYQSDLTSMRNDLSPPHIVQKNKAVFNKTILPPNFNDNSIDDELFNDISKVHLSPVSQKISIKKSISKDSDVILPPKVSLVSKNTQVPNSKKRKSVCKGVKGVDKKLKPDQTLITSFFSA